MSARRRALGVACIGLFVHLLICTGHLALFKWDPTVFLHFGSGSTPARMSSVRPPLELARRVLGPSVQTPNEDGHDGRFFWMLARDPLLRHVDDLNLYVDRPLYRAQRIGYPLLVAPWRFFGERALVVGMLLTNLAVVLLGGYWSARYAQAIGISERAGLAFALNPSVVLAVMLDLSDALALLFLMGMLLALARGRIGWASIAAACAVLSKEPSFLAILGISLLSAPWALPSDSNPQDRPRMLTLRERVLLVTVAALAGGAWGIYARIRFDWVSPRVFEFGLPFAGYLDAVRDYWWPEHAYSDALISTLLLILSLAIGYGWMKRRTLLLRAALPYAAILPFLSYEVVHLMVNSLRAICPALTFVVLDLYAKQAASRKSADA